MRKNLSHTSSSISIISFRRCRLYAFMRALTAHRANPIIVPTSPYADKTLAFRSSLNNGITNGKIRSNHVTLVARSFLKMVMMAGNAQ